MGVLHFLKKRAKNMSHSEAGIAYIEFAISVTVLLIMFFGAIEITRYILIVQKVEKTIDTLTDVLTQSASGQIPNSSVTQYLSSTQTLMNPYTFGAKGVVYLTDIQTDAAGTETVYWQVKGGGTLNQASAISTSGAYNSTPNPIPNFTMIANEEVVVGEIFYNYTPMLTQGIVTSSQLYRVAVFTPRNGSICVNTSTTTCP